MLDIYHISDRDEGFDDEPEEGGSRTFPSRTAFGIAWAIGEKHPNLMASRSFFFGMIDIPMYEYRCVMTMAQIELLSVDKPVIVYGNKKSKFRRPKPHDVMEKAKKWQEKYKDGKKPELNLSKYKLVSE